MFLQSDYPTAAANNQPGGGPAYPLSTPGARLRFDLGPKKDTTLLFAIFNGDPAGRCPGDPDTCNRYGLNFRVHDPALLYAEAQFRRNQEKDDTGLASQLKFGGWSHLGQFNDQRYDYNGVPLASPASNGVAAQHRGDFGIYGIIDQQLYRPQGGDAASGISVYTRASFSPSDRNLVDAYIDGGIVFNGLVPHRPDDKFGAAIIYARFSDGVRGFDRDQINFGTLATPPRDYEANLELTYVAQVVPGWTVQPVYTYIWHPSGTGIRYPDAQIAGVRSIIKFSMKSDPPGRGHAGRVFRDRRWMDGGLAPIGAWRQLRSVRGHVADLDGVHVAPAVDAVDVAAFAVAGRVRNRSWTPRRCRSACRRQACADAEAGGRSAGGPGLGRQRR